MKNHGDYKNDDDAMQIVNKQIRVKDSTHAHVINLEDFQDMVECIEARLIVEAKEMQQLIRARALFTLDENYEEELKEVAGKYDAKFLEGQLSAVFENKIKQNEDENSVDPIQEVAGTAELTESSAEFKLEELTDRDDATQIFNNQSRVEDPFRANFISLEQIFKRQDFQGMVEHKHEALGINVS